MAQTKKERIVYFEYLRILATVGVICIHVAAQNWNAAAVDSGTFLVFNCVSTLGRWGVPVFCMLSGALFLDNDRPLTLKKLYGGNLLRIVTAFVFWSGVYALRDAAAGDAPSAVAAAFLKGEYHMWFLYMIGGLYIVTPLLRKLTEDADTTRLTLAIGFVFLILIPRALHFAQCLPLPYGLQVMAGGAAEAFAQMKFPLSGSYVFYYILGHYLHKYDALRGLGRWGWLMAAAGYAATVLLADWHSGILGVGSTGFYAEGSLNVMLTAVGMFLWVRYLCRERQQSSALVKALSRCSFGVYLVHPLVLTALKTLGLHTLTFHPALSWLAVLVCCAAVSCAAAAVIRKIPLLGKYTV